MGCNCKKKIGLEDRYGVQVGQGPIERFLNLMIKILVFVIVAAIAVLITPIVFVVALYQIFFGKEKGITIPKPIIESIKRL